MSAAGPDAYPIAPLVPEAVRALGESGCAVLSAPTGSGKSTVLPLAFLDVPWLAGRKILMLEPRRIAAYAVADQLAANHGDALGRTVGYRMRLERKVSAATRLEVVTEGMLTRLLQRDPELSGVGLVIFDEFHERGLQADLALALTLEVRHSLRPDLRILAMSATLECEKVAALLDNAPILRGTGCSFPVEIRHFERRNTRDIAAEITVLTVRAWREERGSILVFLPGEADIRRVEANLRERIADPDTMILPLYGKLDLAEQRRAILPCRAPLRKIVLATAIAESSLTIDGVRVVVDSGFTKMARFDPASGLTRLETVPISQAAATQRAGRAGRTEPGAAWRWWSVAEEARREAMRPSEIATADLSSLVLELAAWGVADPRDLRWMELPPEAAYRAARQLLIRLGALEENGRITPHGRKMHELGLDARIGHMVIRAVELRMGHLGCRLAGLLEGFDFRRARHTDVEYYLKNLDSDAALHQAARLARELERRLGDQLEETDTGGCSAGALLALAFFDRIGRRRGALGDLRYLFTGGKGGVWREADDLARHEFLVAVDMEDRAEDAAIRLAAAVEAWEIETLFASDFHDEIVLTADRANLTLEAIESRKLGAVVWREKRPDAPDHAQLLRAIGDFLRRNGLGILDWPESLARLRARVAFLRRHDPEGGWPDWSDEGVLANVETILDGFLPDRFSKHILKQIDYPAAFQAQLAYAARRKLDELAPETLTLPNGRNLKIDYQSDPPVLAGKLQWFFGTRIHPALLRGNVPLAVHLLSPAGRPVQITTDLPGFWQGSYKLVRSELRGRYPKHDWPENP